MKHRERVSASKDEETADTPRHRAAGIAEWTGLIIVRKVESNRIHGIAENEAELRIHKRCQNRARCRLPQISTFSKHEERIIGAAAGALYHEHLFSGPFLPETSLERHCAPYIINAASFANLGNADGDVNLVLDRLRKPPSFRQANTNIFG